MNKPEYLIIHHTASSAKRNQFYPVNNYHRDKKKFIISRLGFYVGYHLFIERSGKVIRARDDWEVGMHTLNGWNLRSIGVCLAGDFNYQVPTRAQVVALRGLIKRYGLPYQFHKEAQAERTCAGRNFTHDMIANDPIVDETDQEKAKELQKRISLLKQLVEALLKLLALRR